MSTPGGFSRYGSSVFGRFSELLDPRCTKPSLRRSGRNVHLPLPAQVDGCGEVPGGVVVGAGGESLIFFLSVFLGKKKSKMVKKTELGDGCCWFLTHLKLFNTLDYFFEWDINEIDGGSVWQMGYEGMNFFT